MRLILRGLASGYRICLSPAENLGCPLGTAEPHLQRIIRKYVSPGQTVYDIGANIGYVSLSLAKRVGPHGSVFAFEPVPKNIEFLRRTLEVNDLTTVKLLEAAASNASGDAVIRMTENLSTPSLVWHRKNPASKELIVKTVVIDHLVEAGEIPRPSANPRSLPGGSMHLRTTGIPIFCGCRQSRQPSFHACVRGGRCGRNGPHQNYDFCGQLTCPPLA